MTYFINIIIGAWIVFGGFVAGWFVLAASIHAYLLVERLMRRMFHYLFP